MSGANSQRDRRTWPPRSLTLAAPTGVYLVIYLAPEHGWRTAGVVGGAVGLFVLVGPALLGALARAVAANARRTTRKRRNRDDRDDRRK